ncbi:retinol dehydrogenase 12 [Teratosphaeria destructans]|uniref:Retinol dehydrogenase 12 n=1 Tax=Teratosphaeria destructans TaxID=418781 RepID=A0A9W7W3L9_9PEZI|nr:retinol dehydrogenase 12 [Teratosphaeria destructans]
MTSIIDNVQRTIAENLGGLGHALAPGRARFSLQDVPDQSGKVAVVTGGSEGIGYGITHGLLSKNISKLFILSVSKDVVDGAFKAIADELGQDKADRAKWIQCDLTDWKRVAQVSQEITHSTDRLDILVNNAARGIMTYQLTDYGVDRHMALNHFGHVILTSHLLPLLKKTASQGDRVRIVNQASNVHQNVPGDLRFDTISDINQDLGPVAQYGRTKLANILYTKYLARHLSSQHPNIVVNATHPGIVSTKQTKEDIHEPYPLGGYGMSVALEPFKKSQFEGCLSALYAATVAEDAGQ